MIDIIKKGIMASIGASVVTKEAIEGALNDLVDKGKLSATEAKQTADKISEEGKAEFENSRDQLNEFFNELLKKANVATQPEIAALEKRISELEAQLAEKTVPASE